MKKFIDYLKDSYPIMLGGLLAIIALFYFGAFESIKQEGDYLPLIIISSLFTLYFILFKWDFKSYKK